MQPDDVAHLVRADVVVDGKTWTAHYLVGKGCDPNSQAARDRALEFAVGVAEDEMGLRGRRLIHVRGNEYRTERDPDLPDRNCHEEDEGE